MKIEFRVEEGVVEIRDPRLFRRGRERFCRNLVGEIVGPGLARRVEIRLGSATCRLEFEPGRFDHAELAKQVALALQGASVASKQRSADRDRGQKGTWISLIAQATTAGPSIVETFLEGDEPTNRRSRPARFAGFRNRAEPLGLAFSQASIFDSSPPLPALPVLVSDAPAESRRLADLALAGGSFALAVASVVLPGVPALPFLLLTGHYLIQSSPGLCGRLENVPGLGSILRKAGEFGRQPLVRGSLWKMLGLTLVAVAAFVILHPPLPVVILLETGVMAYYGVREFRKPAAVALPARVAPGLACLV